MKLDTTQRARVAQILMQMNRNNLDAAIDKIEHAFKIFAIEHTAANKAVNIVSDQTKGTKAQALGAVTKPTLREIPAKKKK